MPFRFSARVTLFATCAMLGAAPAWAEAPATIVYDAHVLTVDKTFSTARAFAVMPDGRFGAVGADRAVLATAGPATVRIDMHGKTIVPGFSDTHVHTLSAKGITTRNEVDLTKARSIADMQKAIADRAATLKPGEWIIGSRGWWDYNLAEKRNPSKADLDKAAPDNPVVLGVTHYSIVNSAALKAAGITRDTPNPQGGLIAKGPDGEPNGLLYDRAGAPLRRLMPRPTEAEAYDGVRTELGRMNAMGITSIREQGSTAADGAMFRKMLANGQLTMRVDYCRSIDPLLPRDALVKALDELGPPVPSMGGMFRSDCISEVNIDGASGLTEFTRAEYPRQPGYYGLDIVPQDKFNTLAVEVARRNWRIAVHAGGDAAIDEALTAFELAGVAGRRWTIDHAILMKPDQYDRIKNLGVLINSQYAHVGEGGKKTLEGWNQEWADQAEHYKDWLAHGVTFAAGSDGPISYKSDPMFWFWGEVSRKTDWGGMLAADQGITREQALRSMTALGPYTAFEENLKGTIEPGKYADFVVLGGDIMTIPIDDVHTTKVLATVLGGKTVYGDLKTAAH